MYDGYALLPGGGGGVHTSYTRQGHHLMDWEKDIILHSNCFSVLLCRYQITPVLKSTYFFKTQPDYSWPTKYFVEI